MTQSLFDRRHASSTCTPVHEQPVHIVRGEGAVLYDADGKRYIDMYNNVPCVGHANPRVAEAMARQLGTQCPADTSMKVILDYAERLISLHHDGIELWCSRLFWHRSFRNRPFYGSRRDRWSGLHLH